MVLVFSSLWLAACGGSMPRAPVGDRAERLKWVPKTHRVRPSDTLYSIAWEYGMAYQDIAQWNRIGAPYTIRVGQVLYLYPRTKTAPANTSKSVSAKTTVKQPSVPQASSPSAASSSRPPVGTPRVIPKNTTKTVVKQPLTENLPARINTWVWPTQGRVVRGFQASGAGKKGIDIAGHAGQDVRAAAAGKVVYSGSGLVGYGRLIIIKHNKHFFSAYGHNQKLLAQEGAAVKAGQGIAHMGSSGVNRVQLHFQIRKDGKPVDPLQYLPKR